MGKEIERKFLINLKKIGSLKNGYSIKQGYVKTDNKTIVRIRIRDDIAFLTLKSKHIGATCFEFEYSIPFDDAEIMIQELCNGLVVEKTRYIVEHAAHTWEIDIFHGNNEGLIVAEVELDSENEFVEMPGWITKEVTNEDEYYNSQLINNPFCEW